MTTAFVLTALAAVFLIGFLLADRRAVRQCNAILHEHCQTLMMAMMEEKPLPEPLSGEEQPARRTMH